LTIENGQRQIYLVEKIGNKALDIVVEKEVEKIMKKRVKKC
jgi:hypothetical protein